MATLQRFRWFGHHVDIDVIVHGSSVRFIALDVLTALNIDAAPIIGSNQPGQDAPRANRIMFCTAWDVVELESHLDRAGYPQAVFDFLEWASVTTAAIRSDLAGVERESLPVEPRVSALDPVASVPVAPDSDLPASYSVQQAAIILGRDPAITMTRDALFLVLENQGWVSRLSGHWEASLYGVNRGFLLVINRDVPVMREPYPQVTLTSAGLAHLHKLLGGVARIELDPTATRNEELPTP